MMLDEECMPSESRRLVSYDSEPCDLLLTASINDDYEYSGKAQMMKDAEHFATQRTSCLVACL